MQLKNEILGTGMLGTGEVFKLLQKHSRIHKCKVSRAKKVH